MEDEEQLLFGNDSDDSGAGPTSPQMCVEEKELFGDLSHAESSSCQRKQESILLKLESLDCNVLPMLDIDLCI